MFDFLTSTVGSGIDYMSSLLTSIYGGTVDTVSSALSGLYDVTTSAFSSVYGLLQSAGYKLLENIISLLPNGGTLPQPVHDAAIGLGSYLSTLSFVFPVYDLILIISVIVSLRLAYFALSIFRSIVSLVRGVQMPTL